MSRSDADSDNKHKHDSSESEKDIYVDYQKELKKKEKTIREYYDTYLITNRVHMHPDYANEWPKFYAERSQQLLSVGLDVSCYDYTMSYQKYFREYLIEKCKSEVEEAKAELFIKCCNDTRTKKNDKHRSRSSGHHSRKRSPSKSPAESLRKKSHSKEVPLGAEELYERSIQRKLDTLSKKDKIQKEVIKMCKKLLELGPNFKVQESKVKEILATAEQAKSHGVEYFVKLSEFNFLEGTSAYLRNELRRHPENFSRRSRKFPGRLADLVKQLQKYMVNLEVKEALEKRVNETISAWKQRRVMKDLKALEEKELQKKEAEDQKLSRAHIPKPSSLRFEAKEIKKSPSDVLADSVPMRGPSVAFNPTSVPNLKITVTEPEVATKKADKIPTASEVDDETLIELFKDIDSTSEYEIKFVRKIMEEIEGSDKPRYEKLRREMEAIQNKFEEMEEGEIASD